jgi:hypothetical protein
MLGKQLVLVDLPLTAIFMHERDLICFLLVE